MRFGCQTLGLNTLLSSTLLMNYFTAAKVAEEKPT